MNDFNLDIELIDLMDTLNFTLSSKFNDTWEYKYSKKLIDHFKLKLLDNIQKKKVLKLSTLFNFLHKKCKYNEDEILNFFESIEVENLSPIISGKISSL